MLTSVTSHGSGRRLSAPNRAAHCAQLRNCADRRLHLSRARYRTTRGVVRRVVAATATRSWHKDTIRVPQLPTQQEL